MDFRLSRDLSEIDPDNLRNLYLTGLSQYLVDPTTGEGYPDSWYQFHLEQAANEFQKFTQVNVVPRAIKGEKHDYHLNDYANFAFLELFEAPILEILHIRVVYPTNVAATEFPPEWAKIQGSNRIQLVPTAGTLAQIILGRGGAYLPLIYEGGLGFLPQLWHIDYQVGFFENKIPLDIYDAVMKLALIEVLTKASDSVYGPGVTNVSTGFDGISASRGITNPLFQARIEDARHQLFGSGQPGMIGEGQLKKISEQYHGIRMRVA